MATSPPPSGSPPSDQEDAALPALRQELRLFPGEPLITGAPTWLLFDPVRNAYHRLERAVYQRLSLWEDQPISRYLARVNARFDMSTDEDDVKELVTFLYAQKLVILPPGGDSESFAAQEFAASPPLSHTLIHKYLFFRIPLVRPDNFLKATYPFIRWIFTRAALYAVIGIGLLGLYFAGRQWDVFASTFLHFLTFEGLIYYGLTLAVLKIFHELGHAYTAHHFGSRVPVMGLAFLVMFPILYTDTTNAWELTDRRKRVLIDAGGILAELMIAALALFAWSFLPDGPMRSAAFFAATTSWVFSLMVNLNPLMRFDGYYLITDLWRVPNLQTAGLDMGRWHLRETLFGLNEPAPECDSKARRRGYIIYAYSVWVYRFFLFIGIALLVHALFPKAIGIILFSVEIGWFIVKPILNELKHWWSIRMKIIQTSRGRGALAVTLGALVFACLPWQSTITAPAILRPAQQSEIYPLEAARIERIYVHNGQNVRAGEPLAVLHSDALDNEHRLAELQLALIEAQLARRAADTQDRSASSVLLGARKRELATLAGLEKSRKALIVRAPHDGVVSGLEDALHTGRTLGPKDRIARIIGPQNFEIIAFPHEDDAARLADSSRLIFIPDDILSPKFSAAITTFAPTSETHLTEDILSSQYRGPLAVSENVRGLFVPNTAIFRITASVDNAPNSLRAVRGVAKIKGKAQSPIKRFGARIGQVLIREADF